MEYTNQDVRRQDRLLQIKTYADRTACSMKHEHLRY